MPTPSNRSQFPDDPVIAGETVPLGARAPHRDDRSERRPHLLVTSAQDHALFMMDPHGVIVTHNPGVEHVLGYPAEEWVGHHTSIVFTPEDRASGEDRRELENAAKNGRAEDVRWHVRHDGSRIWADSVVTPLYDDVGTLIGFGKVLRDTTERNPAQTALGDAEERLRLAAEATGVGTFDFNPVTGELRWDERLKALFGLASDAHVDYEVFLAVTHPEDRERANAIVQRALDPQSGADGEYEVEFRPYVTQEGGQRWVLARGRAFFDAERTRAERFVGTVVDVTERRLAEERQRALLADIFRQAPAFMAVLRGPDHVFEMANPPYNQLVGHRDIIAKPVNEALPEVVEQGFIDLLDRVYQTGEPFIGNDVPILLQRTPADPLEERFLDFTYQALRDAAGTVTGILAHGVDLTKRKRAEDALRASEERYRTLVESIDVGFCIITVIFDEQKRPIDYHFVEVNPAFERHTGLVDAAGKKARELVPELDRFWFETYGRVALTGEPARFESHAPAMRRWFDVYALRIGAPEERKVGVLFTDITERKQAQDALRASEEQLRDAKTRLEAALSAGEIATWTFDIASNRIVPDANLARFYSVSPDDTAGGHLDVYLQAIHPDDRARVTGEIESAIQSGELLESEYRVVLPDGSHRWLIARGRVERDANGGATSLPGVVLDMTARKEAEDALRRAEAELERQARNYTALVQSATDSLARYDRDLRFVFVNPAWEKYTTFSREQVIGKTLREAGFPEENIAAWEPTFRHVLETGEPLTTEVTINLLADGRSRTFERVITPEFDPSGSGEIVTILTFSRDITERKRVEQRERFLYDLTVRTRALLDPDEVLYESARLTAQFLNVSRCTFADVDDAPNGNFDQGTVTVHRDYVRDDVPSIVGTHPLLSFGPEVIASLRAGHVTESADVLYDPRIAPEHQRAFAGISARSFLCAPLFRDSAWVALLVFHHTSPRAWTEEERDLIASVAERTWLAVENARLFRETRARAEREALLNQIGAAVRALTEPEEVLRVAVQALGEALSVDRCYFVTYDKERDHGRIAPDWFREDAGLSSISGEYRMSDFAVNRDADYRSGQTQIVDDVHGHAQRSPAGEGAPPVSPMDQLGLRSLVRAPLVSGRVMTALTVAMSFGPRHWTAEEVRLVETVAAQARAAVEATRVQQRERTIAEQLQAALQPPPPPDLPGLSLDGFYRPALQEAGVGGDFYDVFSVEKGCTALVVADLSGKGLAAAQQVATVRNMLRFALYNGQSLADAITRLHQTLAEHDLLTGFATAFVGMYDQAQRTLTYVNAGQEPGLIWRAATGNVTLLTATGPVLGGFAAASDFGQETVALSDGDVIALFTDGLTDVGRSRRKLLEIEGVVEVLRSSCSDHEVCQDAQAAMNHLVSAVEAYGVGGGLRDDIAVLVGVVRKDDSRGTTGSPQRSEGAQG